MSLRHDDPRPLPTRPPRGVPWPALGVLVAILVSAPPASAAARRAQQALGTARVELQHGDYARAEKAARKVLSDTDLPGPVRGAALTVLGKALFLANRFASGQTYPLGEHLLSGGTQFTDRRAQSKEEAARHEALRQAEAALREAIELGGATRAEASLFLAEALYEGGQIDGARKVLDVGFPELGPIAPEPRATALRSCLNLAARAQVVPCCGTTARAELPAGLVPPKKLSGANPEYTIEARKQKLQGVVILRLVVDEAGRAQCVRPIVGLGLGLTDSAISTVERWKFEPARLDGKTVPAVMIEKVSFRLQ